MAKLSTEHNNAQIMVLPVDFINKKDIKQYINNFLFSKFECGRHIARLKIMQLPWKKANKSTKFVNNKRIVIACDHPAYNLKQSIITYLLSKGYDVLDVGTDSELSTAYSMYAIALGLYANWACCGIAICASGIGISNTVNKFKGLNCCICNKPQSAKIARSKYGANVLGLGARFISFNDACKTIDAFLKTKPKQSYKVLNTLGYSFDKTKFKKIKKEKTLNVPSLLK